MKFNILTIFPDFFTDFCRLGVVGKALQKNMATINFVNPRDFSEDKHQSVDSPPYGGGDGMLMKYGPLQRATENLKERGVLGRVVSLSPQGEKWSNELATAWAKESGHITLVCGRYAGIDQRYTNKYVDEEISMGDFILSGAELAAQVIIDSTMRFVPGVLGHSQSAIKESFNNQLLEAPQFTQPFVVEGLQVPEVLASGHHKNIALWQQNVSIVRTAVLRPDLLKLSSVTAAEISAAVSYVKELPKNEIEALGLSMAQLNQVTTL